MTENEVAHFFSIHMETRTNYIFSALADCLAVCVSRLHIILNHCTISPLSVYPFPQRCTRDLYWHTSISDWFSNWRWPCHALQSFLFICYIFILFILPFFSFFFLFFFFFFVDFIRFSFLSFLPDIIFLLIRLYTHFLHSSQTKTVADSKEDTRNIVSYNVMRRQIRMHNFMYAKRNVHFFKSDFCLERNFFKRNWHVVITA